MMNWFKQNKKRIVYIAGFTVYGLVLYFFFIILTFPKEKLENWMLSQFQIATQSEVTVNEKHFVFPLGTEWKKVTFIPLASPEKRFELDQLNVDFSVFSFLIKRKINVHFGLKGWGGEIRGAWMVEKEEKNPMNNVMVEGEALELKQLPWKKGVSLEGKVKFQTEYRWDDHDPMKGKGFINIEGADIHGRGLSFAGFNLPEISITRLTGHGIIRDGSMTMDRFVSSGPLADLNGTGTLLFHFPFEKSLLSISIQLIPKEELNKIIPLTLISPAARPGLSMDLLVKGTVEQPVFTLTGAPS